MRSGNKKLGFIRVTLIVCIGLGFVFSGSLLAEGQSPLESKAHLVSLETTDMESGNALYKMIVAMSIVAALGVAAIYASKKVLPKLSQTQGKKIKVLETIHLGPRKMVHLLEIGGQQILVGSTPDHITKLVDVIDVIFDKDLLPQKNHVTKDAG
jgi:flagellar biosynthetic protein FliO